MTDTKIYQIPKGQSLAAFLDRGLGDLRRVSAQLVTLAARDADLVVCSEVEEQETVRVGLRHPPDFALDYLGKVTAVHHTGSGDWFAHCDFENPVSEPDITRLVEA